MLIFDFDGVILNSIDEVAVTAYNCISKSFVYSLRDLPEEYLYLWRKYRYHVQPAADFLPFAKWCLANIHNTTISLSSETFAGIIKSEKTPKAKRQNMFFSTREDFVRNHYDAWLKLNHPIQPIWDNLKAHSDKVVILTNKNHKAVIDLCTHYKLNLNEKNVFSADTGTKKSNFLEIQTCFQNQKFSFIDDSIKNLIDLRKHFDKSQLELILANWGYCGPKDESLAKQSDCLVWTQEKTYSYFLEQLPN